MTVLFDPSFLVLLDLYPDSLVLLVVLVDGDGDLDVLVPHVSRTKLNSYYVSTIHQSSTFAKNILEN